jgi:hypothetical protein
MRSATRASSILPMRRTQTVSSLGARLDRVGRSSLLGGTWTQLPHAEEPGQLPRLIVPFAELLERETLHAEDPVQVVDVAALHSRAKPVPPRRPSC